MEEGRLKLRWLVFMIGFAFVCVAGEGCREYATHTIGLEQENSSLAAYTGGKVVLRYRYEDVPFKPYLQELFTPNGVNVLRDAPADHLHHHALMFAVAVDGVNFWEEQNQPGRQKHRSFAHYVDVGDEETLNMSGFDEHLDWVDPRTDRVLLKEVRTIKTFGKEDRDVTLVTWQSKFIPPAGTDSATLTGSAYFGLGMRFLKSMDTGGRFVNSEGQDGVSGTNERRAKWCAYSATAEGKDVTIAMFDDPSNARHPATWFTMDNPFAYLSATLNLHKEPLKVTSTEPLVLRYGVALWDGRVEESRINEVYESWIALSRQAGQRP
jgi:hypothetical protein